jgi:hypothetical protein
VLFADVERTDWWDTELADGGGGDGITGLLEPPSKSETFKDNPLSVYCTNK